MDFAIEEKLSVNASFALRKQNHESPPELIRQHTNTKAIIHCPKRNGELSVCLYQIKPPGIIVEERKQASSAETHNAMHECVNFSC
jgi:hypothetical protein